MTLYGTFFNSLMHTFQQVNISSKRGNHTVLPYSDKNIDDYNGKLIQEPQHPVSIASNVETYKYVGGAEERGGVVGVHWRGL